MKIDEFVERVKTEEIRSCDVVPFIVAVNESRKAHLKKFKNLTDEIGRLIGINTDRDESMMSDQHRDRLRRAVIANVGAAAYAHWTDNWITPDFKPLKFDWTDPHIRVLPKDALALARKFCEGRLSEKKDSVKLIKTGVSAAAKYIDDNWQELTLDDIKIAKTKFKSKVFLKHLYRRVVESMHPLEFIQLGLMEPLLEFGLKPSGTFDSDPLQSLFITMKRRCETEQDARDNLAALNILLPLIPEEFMPNWSMRCLQSLSYMRFDDFSEISDIIDALPFNDYQMEKRRAVILGELQKSKYISSDDKKRLLLTFS